MPITSAGHMAGAAAASLAVQGPQTAGARRRHGARGCGQAAATDLRGERPPQFHRPCRAEVPDASSGPRQRRQLRRSGTCPGPAATVTRNTANAYRSGGCGARTRGPRSAGRMTTLQRRREFHESHM